MSTAAIDYHRRSVPRIPYYYQSRLPMITVRDCADPQLVLGWLNLQLEDGVTLFRVIRQWPLTPAQRRSPTNFADVEVVPLALDTFVYVCGGCEAAVATSKPIEYWRTVRGFTAK